MSYRITIEQTLEKMETVGGDWTTVDTEEVKRDDQWCIKEGEPRTRIKEVYGRTPPYEKRVKTTREVLKQEVEELDLVAVIKAINGI